MKTNKVKLDQRVGVTQTSIGERALASLLSVDVNDNPQNQSEQDLLADAFHAYHGRAPSLKDDVQPDRRVNKHLLDWMMDARNFGESRQSTAGNIAPSLVTSSLAWQMMKSDDALSDALDKQEQAERASEEALKNTLEAAKETDPERVKAKQDMAQRASDQAEKLVSEAIENIEQMKGSPQGQAVMNAITEDAKEEGEKVMAVMRGWGAEAGSMSTTDIEKILEYSKATPMAEKIKKIAEIAGRLKGLSLNTAEDARKGIVGPAVLPDKTTDISRLFLSEFVQISRKAPRALRAGKIAQLIDQGGLLGWIPVSRMKDQGDVEFYIDGSGSMMGEPEIAAKSLCLGIAKAMRNDGNSPTERWYRISTFSTKRHGFVRCDSDDSWATHMDWAAKAPRGGTDFNYVLESAVEKIRERHQAGKKGTDTIMITDGIAGISDDAIEKWEVLAEETGARLIVIAIGVRSHYIKQLEEVADLLFNLESRSSLHLEKVVEDMTAEISEFIVQNERR